MADGPQGDVSGSPRASGVRPGPGTLPLPRARREQRQNPETVGASGRTALRRPAPRRSRTRLTGRAGILALALCAVMVTVAYPLQQYLAQRSQIAALEQQNAATAGQITELRTELAKWSDPGYVAAQARARLHYVRPGETGFIVPDPAAGAEQLGLSGPTAQPWYDRLWSTVKSPSPSPTPAR